MKTLSRFSLIILVIFLMLGRICTMSPNIIVHEMSQTAELDPPLPSMCCSKNDICPFGEG
jgi:hypothetical protein